MRVLGDRLLVEKVDAPHKIGSILLSDNSVGMNYSEGVVVQTGTGGYNSVGVWIDILNVKAGNIVGWLKGSGIEIQVDGKPYTLVREAEVLYVKD